MGNIFLAGINFTNLLVRIQKPHVMIGLILAAIGFATILLARRIARVARKEELRDQPVENNNKVYVTIKAFGLVMLLVALIIMVFE